MKLKYFSKNIVSQPKHFYANRLLRPHNLLSVNESIIDLDLLHKITYWDPKFIPEKDDNYQNDSLNVIKLKDCDLKVKTTYLKYIKFWTHLVTLNTTSINQKDQKLPDNRSTRMLQYVKENVRHSLFDEIDNDKYRTKVYELLEKASLLEPSPEIELLWNLYRTPNEKLPNDQQASSTNACFDSKESSENFDESDAKIGKYLTCLDYLLKGLHFHKWIETDAYKSQDRWYNSHLIIQKLDSKIPILLGDLYNFKALKVSSKLGYGFSNLTEIKELFWKISFQDNSKKYKVSNYMNQNLTSSFYLSAFEGLSDFSNIQRRNSSMDTSISQLTASKSLTKLATSKLHIENSLLSYHLGSE